MPVQRTKLSLIVVSELRKFEAITGHKVRVRHEPKSSVEGDFGSMGNQYFARVDVCADKQGAGRYDLWFWLDRRNGSLAEQLARRLAQTAVECRKMSKAVENIALAGEE